MKPINSYLKINIISQVILILFLLFFLLNESFAKTVKGVEHGSVAQGKSATSFSIARC